MNSDGWGPTLRVIGAFLFGVALTALLLMTNGQATLAAYDFTGQTAAAWAQALGSVVAVIVGAWAVRWQVKRSADLQASKDRRTDDRVVLGFWLAAYQCRAHADGFLQTSTVVPSEIEHEFTLAVSMIRSVPMTAAEDLRAYACAQEVVAMADRLSGWINALTPAHRKMALMAYMGVLKTMRAEWAESERKLRAIVDRRCIQIPERILLRDSVTSTVVPALEAPSNGIG